MVRDKAPSLYELNCFKPVYILTCVRADEKWSILRYEDREIRFLQHDGTFDGVERPLIFDSLDQAALVFYNVINKNGRKQ